MDDAAAVHPGAESRGSTRGVLPWMRFVRRRRLYLPRYWVLAVRYLWRFRVLRRHIRTGGMVFAARTAEVTCRRGLGHMELGRWVWLGEGNAVRCHEGSLRIGDRVVMGRDVTVDAYLDIEIGAECLLADRVLVTDFDHIFDDPSTPIRSQGIAKSRVSIGPDCWIGDGAAILRGSTVGKGSVIGARAVVKGDIPPYSVAVGIPARVIRRRGQPR